MIFLTVGTTKFPFGRILEMVDKVMLKSQSTEDLIVQAGRSNYQFKYSKAQIFKEIPFGRMIFYLKKTRVVVTHGGPATIFLALKYNKNKPLVVPRTKKFGEHVDDHEIFFARFLRKEGKVEAVFPQEDLSLRIKDYLCQPKKSLKKEKVIPVKKLIARLIDYTNEE